MPDRGGALQHLWGALYGAKYCNNYGVIYVAKAPARGGGRALARRRASTPRFRAGEYFNVPFRPRRDPNPRVAAPAPLPPPRGPRILAP